MINLIFSIIVIDEKYLIKIAEYKIFNFRLFENIGLRMGFDVNSHDYNGVLAEEYGVRVSIHLPNELSFPEADGFSIAAGEITHVNLR